MKYQICIIKNRTTEKIVLQKYLDWFSANTPIEIETNVVETDFDVTPQFVGNGTFKGVICSEDIIPKLRSVIPENKYNAVVLYVGNDLGGIRVSVCNGNNASFPLYPDTELIQLRTINDNGKDLNHEMFHGFFAKLRRNGIVLNDPMDTYIQNDNLTVDNIIDTNREMALQLLKPYWDKIVTFRNMTTTWKYFKPTEWTNSQHTHTVAELDKKLVDKLDAIRDACGFPLVITSGYRTVAENAALEDSATNSAHTQRLAVDIACTDSAKRIKLVRVALNSGISRIGIGKTFIHLDISSTLPKGVMWLY